MVEQILKNIEWLGHAGFRINSEKIIIIDPFQIEAGTGSPADILLISHAHYDHCSITDIEKLVNADTIIITEPESASKLSGNIKIIKPGDDLEVSGVKIQAVPSYNIGKDFHPKENNWLGFIITINGINIYFSGDTDLIPEMDDFKVDIALLPVSGTYVMTAEEAIEAAKIIKPTVAIPMHYDSIVGTENDAVVFEKGLQGICRVEICTKK